jgi:tRNA(Arg) A34 adenosine deaminase TadA
VHINPQVELMRETIQLSIENVRSGQGGPFATLVVKDGKVIARGTNVVTSTNDPTAHAEIIAIRAACKLLGSFQLVGCEVYTSCEPCPMCLGAMYWARPDKIFFGNTKNDAAHIGFDDSFIYKEFSIPSNQRKIPMTQILPDEALKAFQEWQLKEDKIKY